MADPGKERLKELILEAIHEVARETGNPGLLNAGERTRLYGPKSSIDSLLFVRIITDIEEKISDELGRDITLINENTLKQETSPFSTIGTLIEFADKLVNA